MEKEKKKDEARKINFRTTPDFRKSFIEQCLAQMNEYGYAGTLWKTYLIG